MSLANHYGLIALIAVALVVAIYIIKNKYTEKTVASAYIWKYSERFLKHKNPLSKIMGIISLILQIAAIILLALVLSQPSIIRKGKAKDYCFILDSSGSMRTEINGRTRFDTAKAKITDIIDGSVNGSSYTVVLAGESAETVLSVSDKDRAILQLGAIEAGYSEYKHEDAYALAQKYYDEDPACAVYLFTDIDYVETGSISLVNVRGDADNYALSDVLYKTEDGKLMIYGSVVSYYGDAELSVSVYLNGEEKAHKSVDISAKTGEKTPFSIECGVRSASSMRVCIDQKDALAADSEVVLYNTSHDTAFKTVIVSEDPFFMTAAFTALGGEVPHSVTPEEYEDGQAKGYDLYVFDGYSPSEVPDSGAVWLIDPKGNVAGSGFSYRGVFENDDPVTLERTGSTSTLAGKMLDNVNIGDIYIKGFTKCGLSREFTTLAYCNGYPVIFAGTNLKGNRQAVYAFDTHSSDIALLADFVVLTGNLTDFMFPQVIDGSGHVCGDTLAVNIPGACSGVRVTSPAGKTVYLDSSAELAECKLDEVGTYSVTVLTESGERKYNVYSALSDAESAPHEKLSGFVLKNDVARKNKDGKYDDLTALFVLVAVLFAADWVVYAYEQYQLR